MDSTAAHPGEVLKQVLADRSMSHAEFARRMGVSAKHISEIINGKTGFSPQFAVTMEKVLGGYPRAEYWIRALAEYQAGVAVTQPPTT